MMTNTINLSPSQCVMQESYKNAILNPLLKKILLLVLPPQQKNFLVVSHKDLFVGPNSSMNNIIHYTKKRLKIR